MLCPTHLILDGIEGEATPRLESPKANVVNSGHSNHKSIPRKITYSVSLVGGGGGGGGEQGPPLNMLEVRPLKSKKPRWMYT